MSINNKLQNFKTQFLPSLSSLFLSFSFFMRFQLHSCNLFDNIHIYKMQKEAYNIICRYIFIFFLSLTHSLLLCSPLTYIKIE